MLEIGCGWGGLGGPIDRPLSLQCDRRHPLRPSNWNSRANGFAPAGYRSTATCGCRTIVTSAKTTTALFRSKCWKPSARPIGRPISVSCGTICARAELPCSKPSRSTSSGFSAYRNRPDFIQRYIFPGGMLPTRSIIEQQAAAAGLQLVSAELFGESYARTLSLWERRFQQAWPAIERLGFDRKFKRTWEYYLSYCQVGFEAMTLNVGLYKFRNPAEHA